MEKKRVLSFDWMKALAIFFVVLGHLIDGVDSPDNGFRMFIYSLHMPLFFIVSGFLSSKKLNSVTNLKMWYFQKLRLLIPFVIFSLGDIFILKHSFTEYLGWHKFGLWFLWTLFLFDTIYAFSQLILLKNKSKWIEIMGLIAPVLICVVLRKFDNTLVGGIFNFMQLYNYAFFVLGVIVVRYNLQSIVLDERVQFGMLCIYVLGLTTGIAALNIPMKACGILVVYGIFEKILSPKNASSLEIWGGKFNKLILCFGRRTLYIYILHFYFIHGKLQLPAYVHDLLFSSPFYYLSIYSIFSFLIMIACVVLADLLDANKYIRKYIFGRRV